MCHHRETLQRFRINKIKIFSAFAELQDTICKEITGEKEK